jgi:tetratricopeptide (TPR) repeat protein
LNATLRLENVSKPGNDDTRFFTTSSTEAIPQSLAWVKSANYYRRASWLYSHFDEVTKLMKTTSPSRHGVSQLAANEEAIHRCETALGLKDQADVDGALKAMRPLWTYMGERPHTAELDPAATAEVFLTAGILTGWVGSREEHKEAQEEAKNLITESITYFESVGDIESVGAARAGMAYCYWRAGQLDEARIMLREALTQLPPEGDARARSLIKLSTIESSALRFEVAGRILEDNAALFENVENDAIRGSYHNERAIVFRNFAKSEPLKRDEYLQKALTEFEKADYYFSLARNSVYRAVVKNNVGLVLFNLSRFKEAHKYLLEAQRLTASLKDKLRVAQIDETLAQVFIAENKLKDAETVIRRAIQVFEKSGQHALLAGALVTQGIALARLKQDERAQFTLERAIEVANQFGAANVAGLAALTMIEELPDMSRLELQSAFERASAELATSLNQDLIVRFHAAANKVYAVLNQEVKTTDVNDAIGSPCDLPAEVLKFEGTLIRRALAEANGSVTRAASLLSLSYQALAYIIGGRHKDLLQERTPVRRRQSHKRAMQTQQN